MQTETKPCQNCKQNFVIEPDDFAFYEKMKVPPPTWCPECSMQRRMTWRNERSLYKRKDAFGKEVISIFAPEAGVTVYDMKKWWSDSWDPTEYGREYDFSKPFFDQFRELLSLVPLAALFNKNAVKSDYCNHTEDMKNCYLSYASIWNEDVHYAKGAIKSKDSIDVLFGNKNELTHETIGLEECYNVHFSRDSVSCTDSMFLLNCSGCSNCFGCVNLRNKSYHIFNVPYSKEEYEKKIVEFSVNSYRALEETKKRFLEFALQYPRKFANLVNSPGSTGDGLFDCKNCTHCFDVTENVENCSYIANAGYSLKDSRHGYGVGMGELMYEIIDSGIGASRVFASVAVRNGTNVRYTFNCHGSSNLFGCIGLRNKNYCILNKQYSKEEFEALTTKIIRHMDEMPYVDSKGRTYRYGEFFPAEISPYAYNETVAQEYFPLTKQRAASEGYRWRDPDTKSYAAALKPESSPDSIDDVDDGITKEIFACLHGGACTEQCTFAFRIIPEELAFYRKLRFPLPRLCPNCRHYRRLAQRNPMRLWTRTCMCAGKTSENSVYTNGTKHTHGDSRCPNEFETSYAPDRPEIVYCEQCYQAETV